MFVTDAEENIVNIWEDYKDETVFAGPASFRVYNPLGAWDTENARSLPNLQGLGDITFRQDKKSLFINDAGGSRFYQIQVYDLFE